MRSCERVVILTTHTARFNHFKVMDLNKAKPKPPVKPAKSASLSAFTKSKTENFQSNADDNEPVHTEPTRNLPPPPLHPRRGELKPNSSDNSTFQEKEKIDSLNQKKIPPAVHPRLRREQLKTENTNGKDTKNINSDSDDDDDDASDSHSFEENFESNPPLPTRPSRKPILSKDNDERPSFISPKKSSSGRYYSDNESDENPPDLPMRRVHTPQRPPIMPLNDNESLGSSSLLFDKAKLMGKDRLDKGIVKFGKMKEKIKNSTSRLELDGDSNDDYWKARESKFNSRSRDNLSSTNNISKPNQQSAVSPMLLTNNSKNDGWDKIMRQMNLNEEELSETRVLFQDADISIDEDRPPLPIRRNQPSKKQNMEDMKPIRPSVSPIKNGPLPSALKPKSEALAKSKPAIPSKPKPMIAPKPKLAVFSSSDIAAASPPSSRQSSPPLPPPSRISASSGSSAPPPPPTPRINAWKEPKLDLELETLWFVDSSLNKMPACFVNKPIQCSFGYTSTHELRTYAVRLSDLATAKLKLSWKKDTLLSKESINAISQSLSFIPPPKVSKQQLQSGHEKYGEHVANWCEVKLGKTVGDGECWTLARDALSRGCGGHAFVSTATVHGAEIEYRRDDQIIRKIENVKRGDILQFKKCLFENSNGWCTYGDPDHTAIVVSVRNDEINVLHQNVNGVKVVAKGIINLKELQKGEIWIYRPVDSDWVVNLEDVLL